MTAAEFFVTAPSTPEAPSPTAVNSADVEEPAPRPDTLEIVVERRLLHEHGDGAGSSSAMTIFRVPAHVRDASKELYEPRLVSIGPYYRGRDALRGMEQHKWRYLRELVAEHPASLADYVGAVRGVEHKARRCYSERTDIFVAADDDAQGKSSGGGQVEDGQSRRVDPGPVLDDFAEMLLLDGCFVLQFFIKWHNKEPDALCDVGWGLPLLHSDLLLLENQIPFFVLEALFRVAAPDAGTFGLRRLIVPHLRFHDSTSNELSTEMKVPTSAEIHHLLHLFYEAFMPTALIGVNKAPPEPEPDRGTQPAPPLVVPSVTQLREAGVRFERNALPRHMFDVTFDSAKGVVRMPGVEVDNANKPLLVNLVAFEQSRQGGGAAMPLSSYAALVSALVRTGEDVEQLQRRGIMDNLLATGDDAATGFFQKLGDCSSLEYEGHLFAVVFAELNKYYVSSWRRHKAKFLRDHCSSPWAVVALVVAAFAFCFGLVKFSTAIYGLVRPGHCHC